VHLRDRCLRDSNSQRLLDELGWSHDRGNLLRFLGDPRVAPMNNRVYVPNAEEGQRRIHGQGLGPSF
jgi:hypothetical protein